MQKLLLFQNMIFQIYEQKFLELIEDGETLEGVKCLRQDLAPLNIQKEHLQKLAQILLVQDKKQIYAIMNWPGKGRASRSALMNKLQSYLPHHIMLPPNRLSLLLQQAQKFQQQQCLFSNGSLPRTSLLYDAQSPIKKVPSKCIQTLNRHAGDINYCRFNNSGTHLATGSKDETVVIWAVAANGTVSYEKTLSCDFEVTFFAWSPNDELLAVVGAENTSFVNLWEVKTGTKKHESRQSPDDSLTSVAWFPDGDSYVCGGKRGQFYQVNLEGHVIETFDGVRVFGLHVLADGRSILASDSHNRIRSYDFEAILDKEVINRLANPIMTFSLSSDENYILLNVLEDGLHLYDLSCNTFVRKYRGNRQSMYQIHSAFGGDNDELLATGSECGTVYIFHREKETPIKELTGHSIDKCVNCVHFHPIKTNVLASVSDDQLLKIWMPDDDDDFGQLDISATTSL